MLSGSTRFPIGLLSLLVWALAWALPLGRPLHAQGTVGEFPDPITSVEFAALLRLHTDVTEVEWPVLHVMHEDYIAAAAVLRHGEIQAYLDERTRRMGSFFNVTVEKELLPRRRRAIASLEALERTLFDGVAAILGEGAEERVVGARLDRRWQLATFTIGQQGLWQSRDQTLAGVVLDHRWSEVEKSVVLPRCRAYQERVVGILDRLVVVAADAVPFEGLNGGPVSDATASARESARRAKSELQKCHRAFVAELSRDLEAAVGPEVTQVHMLRIRSRWIQAKYGGIWSSVSFDSPLKAGLRKRGITEEERLGLEAAIVELRAEDDRLIEEGMRLLDADEIAHVPGTMNQSNPRAEEIRTARSELFRKARAKAAAILGETISRSLERKAWARDQSDPTWNIDPNEPDPAPKVCDQRASFMPFEMARRPMDLDAVRRLAGDGATPAETSAALETIHAEYLARWEREVSPLVQPASAGVPRGMQAWPEQLRHAREIAVAVEVVDASLFSALATAFGPRAEDSLRQARLNRQFELWTSRPMAISGLVSQVERPWNPLSALRSFPLEESDLQELTAITLAHANRLLDAARAYREAEGTEDVDAIERGRRIWRTRVASSEAFEALRRELIAAVDEEARPRLEALLLVASVNAMRDFRYAGELFGAALRLESLPDETRARLLEARAAFDRRYLDCCRRMQPDARPEPREPNDLYAEHSASGDEAMRQDLAQFEREELNAHVISRLRGLLSAEQQASIPALDRLDVFRLPIRH